MDSEKTSDEPDMLSQPDMQDEPETTGTDGGNSSNGAKHEHLYTCLGEVIRDRRKTLDLSQAELAADAGIDRAFLSNLERGQRKPSFGTVARIAHGLKLKYSRLVAKCEKCQMARAKSA